jgi:hypothetical protein
MREGLALGGAQKADPPQLETFCPALYSNHKGIGAFYAHEEFSFLLFPVNRCDGRLMLRPAGRDIRLPNAAILHACFCRMAACRAGRLPAQVPQPPIPQLPIQ